MDIVLTPLASLQESVEINSLAFSPDGTRLACGGFASPQVEVRDLASGAELFSLDLQLAGTLKNLLTWSAGNLIAAVGQGGSKVGIWRGDDGSFLRWLDTEVDDIACLAFDASGRQLCVAGSVFGEDSDADVAVFDTSTWVRQTFDSGMQVYQAAWAGDILAAAGESRDAQVRTVLRAWRPAAGTDTLLDMTLSGMSESEAQLAFDRQGRLHVMSWNNETSELIWRTIDIGRQAIVRDVACADAHCEGLFFSAVTGQLVLLVPDASGQVLKLFDADGDGDVESGSLDVPGDYFKGGLAVSTDGSRVAVASDTTVTVNLLGKV